MHYSRDMKPTATFSRGSLRSLFAVSVVGLAVACSSTSANDPPIIIDPPVDASADSSTADSGPIKTSCSGTERIEFKIKVPDGATKFCSGAGGTTCAPTEFVTVKKQDGTALGTLHRNCRTLCEDSCEPIACATGCPAPGVIGTDGAILLWDGTFFQEKESTCPSGRNAGMHCTDTTCVSAGAYVATMCAYPIDAALAADAGSSNDACMAVPAGAQPKCVDVPFTWPPATAGETITGTIAN